MKRLLLLAVIILCGAAWSADEAALLQRGEELVMGRCFLCHGATGDSSSPLYPKLAGQNREYLIKQMNNFRRGERDSADMRKVVADMDEHNIQAAAFFFSRQEPSRGNSAYAEMRALGEKLFLEGNPAKGLKPCRECHGERGAGSATLPRIAGQHTLYVETQLTLFEERKRTNDNAQMQDIARLLATDEIRALAEYLRSL